MRPRLGSAEGEAVNASVGVRIIPTKALEQRTKIYQDTKEMRFKRKSCAKTVPKKKKPSTWDYLTPEKCKTKHTTQDSDDSEMEFRLHKVSVTRWQNLIPSFPWIAPGWRDQILQRSVAEP